MTSKLFVLILIAAACLASGCTKKDNNDAPFKALFSYNVSGFATNFSNFTDFRNYTGPYAEYSWDFGDGTTSTELSPSHLYNAIGEYKVVLTAKKLGQTSTFSDNVTIKGPEIKIEGDFTDWEHVAANYTNEDGSAILQTVKAFQSGGNVNFYVEGSTDMDFSEVTMYFDTDSNSSTGFQLSDFPMGSGAEYKFYGEGLGDYTEVSKHQGAPGDDDWDNVFTYDASDDASSNDGGPTFSKIVALSNGHKAIEFSFPKALLGGIGKSIGFAIYDDNTSATLPVGGTPSSMFIKAAL